MASRGFTIVELIITITVMGILMTLAVVNINASQVKARDEERRVDVQAIQMHLEDFYTNDGDWGSSIGRYPSTNLPNGTVDFMRQALRDVDMNNLTAPGASDPKDTFIAATNAVQTTSGVTPLPTTSQYVYQPINTSGGLCTTNDCRKYNIFYRLEGDNTVYMVTSKNQ